MNADLSASDGAVTMARAALRYLSLHRLEPTPVHYSQAWQIVTSARGVRVEDLPAPDPRQIGGTHQVASRLLSDAATAIRDNSRRERQVGASLALIETMAESLPALVDEDSGLRGIMDQLLSLLRGGGELDRRSVERLCGQLRDLVDRQAPLLSVRREVFQDLRNLIGHWVVEQRSAQGTTAQGTTAPVAMPDEVRARLMVLLGRLEDLRRRLHDSRTRMLLDRITSGAADLSMLRMAFEEMWQACAARSAPLSVAVLELEGLDGFEKQHGWHAAEQAMRSFGDFLVDQIRPGDRSLRHSRSEFLLLLPNTGAQGCNGAMQRLMRTATAQRLSHEASGWPLRFIAGHVQAREPELDTALARADDALDEARRRRHVTPKAR